MPTSLGIVGARSAGDGLVPASVPPGTGRLLPDRLYAEGLQRQRFLPAIGLLQRFSQVIALNAAAVTAAWNLRNDASSSLSGLTDRSEEKSVLRQFLGYFEANSGAI